MNIISLGNRNLGRVRIILINGAMFAMPWPVRDKERERFYLLPGMGGRGLRRKRRIILFWAVVAGLIVSALLAGFLYLLSLH